MKTSYFAKSGALPNAISIAGKAPDFFKGKHPNIGSLQNLNKMEMKHFILSNIKKKY